MRMKITLESEKKKNNMKTFEEKLDDKSVKANQNWIMIKVIEKYLLYFAVLDFTRQIIAQMPIIYER
jgi:hypothetical protein